jgi:hypothetical protein
VVADSFQQPDLAVTDCSSVSEVETQGEPRHGGELYLTGGGGKAAFFDAREQRVVDSQTTYFAKYIDADRPVAEGTERGRDDNHPCTAADEIFGCPDGEIIAIGVADEEGKAGALMLPTACLRELMMTLPEMMRRAQFVSVSLD